MNHQAHAELDLRSLPRVGRKEKTDVPAMRAISEKVGCKQQPPWQPVAC